jgi:hypothetical protein
MRLPVEQLRKWRHNVVTAKELGFIKERSRNELSFYKGTERYCDCKGC